LVSGKKMTEILNFCTHFFLSFLFLLNLLRLSFVGFVAWYSIRFRSCWLYVQIYIRFNLKSNIFLVYGDVMVVKIR
jgi:hypothetical protein